MAIRPSTITPPDVDNYPFDWTEGGGSPGPEDVDDRFTGPDR